ncbi:MAG: hypothetical protein A2032_02635 [Chloroflexi bacterium RBG_19FT_COMBO_49_13]|nr:MAG: hypothetical protein A2032_02635 [Chloroflexi bacterium RBG_19FT_COMBO_49_13]
MLALILTLLVFVVMAGPALAAGVSETGLGRCENPAHAPGTGQAGHIWVPGEAWENLNGGESGLHFMTTP